MSARAEVRGGGPEPREPGPRGGRGTGHAPSPRAPGCLGLAGTWLQPGGTDFRLLAPRAVPPGNKFPLFSGTQFGAICYGRPRTLPDSAVLDVSGAQKLLGAHLQARLSQMDKDRVLPGSRAGQRGVGRGGLSVRCAVPQASGPRPAREARVFPPIPPYLKLPPESWSSGPSRRQARAGPVARSLQGGHLPRGC